ncbi:hypothetical protein LIER_29638 [Lithospermum erythrorhizon]|uniref:Uncharacterized protein n=1 Tax=Lithospermum erythrorhizon TaxID=34254 RepID=A0AAV3RN78_LITER
MLSLTAKPPKLNSISTPFLSPCPLPSPNDPSRTSFLNFNKPTSISALLFPPSPPSQIPKNQPPLKQTYQPFRPPPSPLPPKFRDLDTNSRLEVLTNRLAAWFEYAPLIPALIQEHGLSPESIEEITGISVDEQNRLVVATKVRDTLVESNLDPQVLATFDNSGAELLYEIRVMSNNQQRTAAVEYAVNKEFDTKKTGELARAIKDYPKRRGDKGWGNFDGNLPGDCLAFMYYRQAQEHRVASSEELTRVALERAMEVVESDVGRSLIEEELKQM